MQLKLFYSTNKKDIIKHPEWNWKYSRVFSNLYCDKEPLLIDGEYWTCVEQYYQAQKFTGRHSSKRHREYYNIIRNADSGKKIVMLGELKLNNNNKLVINKNTDQRLINDVIEKYKDLRIREDWEEIKIHVMIYALIEKFTYYEKLKNIIINNIEDDDYLVYNSGDKDKFFGDGEDNVLGKILTIMHHMLKYGHIYTMSKELKNKVQYLEI